MAKTVSLINMKGGVGKSTITANLAWHYAAYSNWKKKVLVVDLDPQFNSSQYLLGYYRYMPHLLMNKPTVWEIFEQHTVSPNAPQKKAALENAIVNVATYWNNESRIDIIPSRLELAHSLRSPGEKASLLAQFLETLEDRYDLILIDCAPTESFLTTAAYLASQHILVPVKLDYLSTIGLPLLARSINDHVHQYKKSNLQLSGIVFNATTDYSPEETTAKKEVLSVAKSNNWHVFSSEISYSKSYPKGAREGKPIFWTSYSRSRQCKVFLKFATEFAERIDL